MSERLRLMAREIFSVALAACSVREAVLRAVHVEHGRLTLQGQSYDLAGVDGVRIVAIGKAAATMFDAVRPLLLDGSDVRAVISAPEPPRSLQEQDLYFAGGHPLPNEASLAAARAAMELLAETSERTLVLFLISGGASAMFEAPISAEIGLGDLLEVNRRLVGSGAPIAEINCVRKHLSAVKGGRLLLAAGPALCVSLLVSDVPEGRLDALGSGPTLGDSTSVADCVTLVEKYLGGTGTLPPGIAGLFTAGLPETPKPGDAVFARVQSVVVLDNARLVEAAGEAAWRRGFRVVVDNGCDDWEYREAADFLLKRMTGLAAEGGPVCLISGGEVTVQLPEGHGVGGRNQQWALACAQRLQGSERGWAVLSAGSDGVDGSSPAAGCVADETTWMRAVAAGLDPAGRLAGFDTYPLFRALGDSVETGPTGNNLRDLRLLMNWPGEWGSVP